MTKDTPQILEVNSVKDVSDEVGVFLKFLFNDVVRRYIDTNIHEHPRDHARAMRDDDNLYNTFKHFWPYTEVVAKYFLPKSKLNFGPDMSHKIFVPEVGIKEIPKISFLFSFPNGFEGEQSLEVLESIIKNCVMEGERNIMLAYWVNRDKDLSFTTPKINNEVFYPCYLCARFG